MTELHIAIAVIVGVVILTGILRRRAAKLGYFDKTLRQYALVRHNKESVDFYSKSDYFKKDPAMIFFYLGEIPNMPGHGIFIGRDSGKVYGGLHIDSFEEIPEDES